MESTLERKRRFIRDIQKAHPIYLPDTHIAKQTGKALERLPEQAVFYLWHLLGDNEKHRG